MKDAVGAEFLRLVRPQWNRLHFVARRYAAGAEDTRDLVQETLLRAWRSYSPMQERTFKPAWLFVVMRSTVIDWARTAKRRIRLVPAADSELTELAPADLTEPFSPLTAMDEQRFRQFLDNELDAPLSIDLQRHLDGALAARKRPRSRERSRSGSRLRRKPAPTICRRFPTTWRSCSQAARRRAPGKSTCSR